MIWEKKQLLVCLFLLSGVLVAAGRRFEQRSYKQRHNKVKHYTPLLRQLDTATITGTADDLMGTGTGTSSGMDADTSTAAEEYDELNYDNHKNDTKPADALILINPKEGADTSRMFKGFFLRRLLGSGIGGGGSNGNANVPYIILNIPNNITNVNINSLNNTAATTTTTTTTTTVAPARRQVFYQPFTDIPTEIYYHRRSKPEQQAQPQNFIRSPSNQLLPVYLPPEIEHLMQVNSVGQRRRAQLKRKNVNNQNNLDPFSFLGNSLRQIQYL